MGFCHVPPVSAWLFWLLVLKSQWLRLTQVVPGELSIITGVYLLMT